MTNLERIWGSKSDDALLEAAASLDDFTDEGRRVVLAELEKRGLDVPEPEGGESGDAPDHELAGEALPDDPLSCLGCGVALQHLGAREAGSLGEFGTLFEEKQALQIYVCPACGHVDLFTDLPAQADS
jgi:hypothetical protein